MQEVIKFFFFYSGKRKMSVDPQLFDVIIKLFKMSSNIMFRTAGTSSLGKVFEEVI